MKASWQWEQEALDRLGFSGVNGSADRARAVEVVIELLREKARLLTKEVKV